MEKELTAKNTQKMGSARIPRITNIVEPLHLKPIIAKPRGVSLETARRMLRDIEPYYERCMEEIFRRNPTTSNKLRNRRLAELWANTESPYTHTMHLQTNIGVPVSNSGSFSLTPGTIKKGMQRLSDFDRFFNGELLGSGWEGSPFRVRWNAYVEVGEGKLHYHFVVCVDFRIAQLFESRSPAIIDKFNSQRKRHGCSVKLDPIEDEERQLSYAMKDLSIDQLYDNRVSWLDNRPKTWPHLIQKDGRLVAKKGVRARDIPHDWSIDPIRTELCPDRYCYHDQFEPLEESWD